MLSLPSEIITAILQNADSHKDLKHTRLSCKRLDGIAAKLLFREVTVVPHVDSFEQLLQLSKHPLLRRHVKSLVYDTRTIWVPANLLELEIDADPLHQLSGDTPASRLRLRSSLRYHDEQTFRTEEQTGQELQYLLRVFESLPSLKAIEIRNIEGPWVGGPALPHFYERMSKQLGENHESRFASMGEITRRTRLVLLCAYVSDLKLEHLRLEDVKWDDLFSFGEVREVSRYLEVLTQNLSAKLVERGCVGFSSNPGSWADIYRVVAHMLNLKSLELRFGSAIVWGEKDGERALLWGPLFLDLYLPRLQTLRLERFTASAHELLGFLLKNSASLTSLTIEDARLLRELGKPRPSWPNVIRRLQDGLHLEKACLEGVLSNGGDHYWSRPRLSQGEIEVRGKRNLKSQAEYFLVHGGDCPLDRAIARDSSAGEPMQPLWRVTNLFTCPI